MNIRKILKEEIENKINKYNDIALKLNHYATPKYTIFDKSGSIREFKYFVPFGKSVNLDGYNADEIAKFPSLLSQYLSNNEFILVTKVYSARGIYMGKPFNDINELVEYCTINKVENIIGMESQDEIALDSIVPDFKIEKNKNDVTFPEALLSKLEISNGLVTLYHYGDHDLENGVLDPKHYKKNAYTSDTYGQPRVFFYINKNDKERIVNGKEYIVKVPLNDLYPFNYDPFNYYNEAVKEYGNKNVPVARQVIYITASAIRDGFKGMFFAWENTYRLDYFYPIKPLNI